MSLLPKCLCNVLTSDTDPLCPRHGLGSKSPMGSLTRPSNTVPAPIDSVAAVLNERGKRYGIFTGHAAITQQLKDAMHNHAGWVKLAPDQCEALEMIAHKIGRILNGDPDYDDSWVDIAGYAKLVADRLQGTTR